MDVLLVKLGGSLVTDKGAVAKARSAVIARLAEECARGLAGRRTRVIIGHGSGSFGHAAAAAHGIDGRSSRRHPPVAIAAVQDAAHELHRKIVSALRSAGVPTFSTPPSACGLGADGAVRRMGPSPAPWLVALERGLVPVTCGDVVLGSDGSATICSTEAVLEAMARRLMALGNGVRRALWMGVTDGILADDGQPIDVLGPSGAVASAGESDATDVTGGMRLRVDATRRLARKGVESWILDGRKAGVLERGLRGERVGGTRVTAREG